MKKVTIVIETKNDAFKDHLGLQDTLACHSEIASILRGVSIGIATITACKLTTLFDSNGKEVGTITFE